MTHYLLNAFSLNMLTSGAGSIKLTEKTQAEAAAWLLCPEECFGNLGMRGLDPRIVQAVGHADTAGLFGRVLDLDGIVMTRTTVTMNSGDTALVGQYSGPRLPEGATTLPEGATIRWLLVTID